MPLPRVSQEQRRYILARPGLRDPATTTVDDMARGVLLIMDLLHEEDQALGITGAELVADMNGLSFAHAAQMTPPMIKKMSTIMQV